MLIKRILYTLIKNILFVVSFYDLPFTVIHYSWTAPHETSEFSDSFKVYFSPHMLFTTSFEFWGGFSIY